MIETSIKNLLNSNNDALGSILTRIALLKQWNNLLSICLPDEKNLFQHCQIVRLEQGVLVMIADNAHWATRLRFLTPELIKKLQQYPDFQHIHSIQCKIYPSNFTPQRPIP